MTASRSSAVVWKSVALTKAATTYVNAYRTFVNTGSYDAALEDAVHEARKALEFAAESYAEAVLEEGGRFLFS